MNYQFSNSTHTLTHWQSGLKNRRGGGGIQTEDPLLLHNVKTLEDLVGYKMAGLSFGGWCTWNETSANSGGYPSYMALATAHYVEEGATAIGNGIFSTGNTGTDDSYYTIYSRAPFTDGALVYNVKYPLNNGYYFYLQIRREDKLVKCNPQQQPLPGNSLKNNFTLSAYKDWGYDESTETGSPTTYSLTTTASNFPFFKSGYTGDVIVPYIRRYKVYAQVTNEEPNELFSASEAKELNIDASLYSYTKNGRNLYNWLTRIMYYDTDLQAVKELQQVPSNLLDYGVIYGNMGASVLYNRFAIQNMYTYNDSVICGGSTRTASETASQSINGPILLNSQYVNYYKGPIADGFTYLGNEVRPRYEYSGLTVTNSNDIETTELTDGLEETMLYRVVDLKVQHDFQFFT